MKIPTLPGFDPQAFAKYLRNTGWLLTARVGSLFLKMIITAVALPNYLGADQFGMLNYPLVLITFFMAISALGMDSFVTRQLLQDPAQKHRILGTAFGLRLAAGIAVIPLIFGVYFAIVHLASQPPAAPLSFIAIVSLICIFQSIHIIDNYFQSRAEGKFIMWVHIGGNLLSAAIKLVLILVHAPLIAFVWMLALDVLIISLAYVLVYKGRGEKLNRWKYHKGTAKTLLKYSWPLAFSALFVSLYMKIDQLMIDAFLGKEALGVYTTGINLSEAWYFVPMAIVTSLFPAIMHARQKNPGHYLKRMHQLYDLMVVLGLSVAILMTIASPFLYQWFYKPEFQAGAFPLTVLSLALAVRAFFGPAALVLSIHDRPYATLPAVAVGISTLVAANFLLVPPLGLLGGALAALLAQTVWSVALWLTALKLAKLDVSVMPRLRDILAQRREAAAARIDG